MKEREKYIDLYTNNAMQLIHKIMISLCTQLSTIIVQFIYIDIVMSMLVWPSLSSGGLVSSMSLYSSLPPTATRHRLYVMCCFLPTLNWNELIHCKTPLVVIDV